MKKLLGFTAIFLSLCFAGFGQQNCDSIKKENANLKRVLSIFEPVKTASSQDLDFIITKVQGNIKTQAVTITFMTINRKVIRNVSVDPNSSNFITIDGDKIGHYGNNNTGLAYGQVSLGTDVPVKSSFQIGPILPSVDYLKYIGLYFYIQMPPFSNELLEFRDLKIDWK